MWRVLVGLHETVTLSFMLVGHTKFAPDWCFGLIKQRLRKTQVSCLGALKILVEESARANSVQLVGDESGQSIVPMYNWATFLQPHFNKVVQIKKFHHFSMSANAHGKLRVKKEADGEEHELTLLRGNWLPTADSLPAIITPPGLPLARQQYLFEKVRPYCPDSVKDVVCPPPSYHTNF